MTARKKTTTKGGRKGKANGSEAEPATTTHSDDEAERFRLTPEQAVVMVRSWDTSGDGHTGDLILLCRALVYDRDRAEDILIAIEKEKILHSPAMCEALDSLVEQRREAWQQEGPR